jgi:hypothetical protein
LELSLGIAGIPEKAIAAGKMQLLRALTPILPVRVARIDDALRPLVAPGHFAPGKLCRIIDLDVIAFLESVSREVCVFESRAKIFCNQRLNFYAPALITWAHTRDS